MKAIECVKYGAPEVLQFKEVDKPVPTKNELLIKIHATAVTGSDLIVRGFKLPAWSMLSILMRIAIGFRKPRNPILGMIISGEIESTGNNVNRFKSGDRVFGWTLKSGGTIKMGTYAEYICVHENSIITIKPDTINYKEAAAIPYGGLIGLYFLKKGQIENCKNVLIYGASGAIGSSAVQIAKAYGAKVTGICSTRNLEMVKSIGADIAIDYTKEDISDIKDSFDLIVDSVPFGKINRKELKSKCMNILSPNGKYISINDGSPQAFQDDLEFLKKLIEKDKFKAVIDKIYPLEKIVEAHEHAETGHKRGNIIIVNQNIL
jgi:NADPH:quinone reductase-like Zn-dependent oxidoreductase